MKGLLIHTWIFVLVLSACNDQSSNEVIIPPENPIQLHPGNPHYFLYQGKTMALITSAEHYGAVLNLDFDYSTYLETLASEGMNYTRIFTGTYFEIPGESFGIQNNTLAPEKNRVITPWAIAITDLSGKVKFDLASWNNAYFDRLKDFISVAADNNIIVEVTLFSSIYRDEHWAISPQNPANNLNITHEIDRFDAQTMSNGDLFKFQESFVRKMVNELNEFNNFFFEIQNEPWSDHAVPVYNIMNKEDLKPGDWTFKSDFADAAAMLWQQRLAEIIVEEETNLPKKHLIAQNYTNFKASIPEVDNNISIINFHYAWPEAVEWNYHYNKVIGFDESGFAGSTDQVYRKQAWRFMLSGGGLFNNLDYSFFAGNEDGLGENNAPGGGSKTLRKQLKILSDFLHGFDLENLKPYNSCVSSSPGMIPYVLSDGSNQYALFIEANGTKTPKLQLRLSDGSYIVQKINTITGSFEESEIESIEGQLEINIDIPDSELAIRITRH